MAWWTALLGPIASIGKTWLEGRELKAKQAYELKRIRLLGELKRAQAIAQAEADYDNYAQIAMKSSWKDEYLVIVLSAPFIISFAAPFVWLFTGIDITEVIDKAWATVGTAPDWYQWSFIGIIIATFGLRWMTKNHIKAILPEKMNGKSKNGESSVQN